MKEKNRFFQTSRPEYPLKYKVLTVNFLALFLKPTDLLFFLPIKKEYKF